MLDYSYLNNLYYKSNYNKNVLGAQNKAKGFWDWLADPNREEFTNAQDVGELFKSKNVNLSGLLPETVGLVAPFYNGSSSPGMNSITNSMVPTDTKSNNPIASQSLNSSMPNSLQNQYKPKRLSYSLLRSSYGGL